MQTAASSDFQGCGVGERGEEILTFYDESICAQMWTTPIAGSSQGDLVKEILRKLQTLFTNIQIPIIKKVFVQFWVGAYLLQYPNSMINNKQITQWALKSLARFTRNQLNLVIGEAFHLDRPA